MKTSTPALLGLLTAIPANAYKCGTCGRGHHPRPVETALWNQLLASSFPDPRLSMSLLADYDTRTASPSYLVEESPSHYRMEVELPGVNPSTIEIAVATNSNYDRTLKLSCDHKRKSAPVCSHEWQLARDVDDALIEAHYDGDGVLEIVAPKRIAPKSPTKINVTGRPTVPQDAVEASKRAHSEATARAEDQTQADGEGDRQQRWREAKEVTSKLLEKVQQTKQQGRVSDKPTVTATVDHFIPSAAMPTEDASGDVALEDNLESGDVMDLDDAAGNTRRVDGPSHPGQPI